MLRAVDDELTRLSPGWKYALVLLVWGAVSATDYLSGCEIALAILYLVPITMATWYAGRGFGLLVSLLSTLAVIAPDVVESGLFVHHPCYLPWKWFIYCGVFLFVVILMNSLHAHLENERRLARLDSLTGLLNRRAFSELLELYLGRAAYECSPLSLAYLDLDDFKTINDDFGHHGGDHVLETVGGVLTKNCRSGDVVARIGGDEFALLLPNSERLDAENLIARLRESLMQTFSSGHLAVTCSIGVVTFRTLPKGSDEAMRIADSVMYRVKSQGKNAVDFLVAET